MVAGTGRDEPPDPASHPASGRGRLDIVATPIGNLQDLSPRARQTLADADAVAAEDTRRTGALLSAIGLSKPLISLHEHNERDRIDSLLSRIEAGQKLAVVSDAGTPLVSDPGYALVTAAIAAGHPVSAIPGPCAALMALTLSGLPAERFVFEGFLPARGKQRLDRLRELAGEARTLILFEAPHRVVQLMSDLVETFGPERRAAVARELSKTFETIYRGSLSALAAIAGKEANFARGELTVVIEGASETAGADEQLARQWTAALATDLPPGRVAGLVAQMTGMPRSVVYGWLSSERDSREN